MSRKSKLLQKVLNSPRNIQFNEMVRLIESFGFHLARIKGSHHIFSHPDIPELVNLQNVKGNAKPYQIQQFMQLVERYDLKLGDDS